MPDPELIFSSGHSTRSNDVSIRLSGRQSGSTGYLRKLWVFMFLGLGSCSVRPALSLLPLDGIYQPPDYSDFDNWAALPFREDNADATPDRNFVDCQEKAEADVFFLHPTSYTGDKGQKYWNAPLNSESVNRKTDRTSILHQASIFNEAGKIYAPRYRQAHLKSYFTKNEKEAKAAFELAYKDIVTAFEYYLEHFNDGRPIILACHSQGASHGMRLLKEFFEGKELQSRLVVAYLVGMPVAKDYFSNIPICESPDQTGCYCTWRTFRRGYIPKKFPASDDYAVVNPLTWKTSGEAVSKEMNQGAVLRKFEQGIWPQLMDAQINGGVLWASRPRFPGSFLFITKNYHIGDFNLYWVNVRENASHRAAIYLNGQSAGIKP